MLAQSSDREAGLLVEVARLRSLRASSDVSTRLEAVTRPLLGRPYLLSPLGEGEAFDPDPRLRLDAFDCTTFVETALALVLAPVDAELVGFLDSVRYRGDGRDFSARRHLIASQWIPDLIDQGLLVDVTREVGGSESAAVTLDPERWRTSSLARRLPIDEDSIPIGTFSLPYVPLARARELLASAPPGLIVSVVRAEHARSPILVTHQALLLQRSGGEIVLRHASVARERVVDETLERFVRRLEQPRQRPVVGLNLLRVRSASG